MLRRVLKAALVLVALVVLTLVGVGVAARFHDGPIGPFPGGAFVAGDVAGPGASDFSAVKGVDTLELEMTPDHPRSITAWFVVVGGTLYVPSASAAKKTWPGLVAADGRVRVRIGGKIYDLQATRVTESAIAGLIAEAVTAKYGFGDGSPVEGAWAFELLPRS